MQHKYSNTGDWTPGSSDLGARDLHQDEMARDEIEAVILACGDKVTGLAQRLAWSDWSGRVEVADLVQIGMLAICQRIADGYGLNTRDPRTYLYVVAKQKMCEEWTRLQGWPRASLDCPLREDTVSTLYDLLAAPVPEEAAALSAHEQALHAALERVRPSYREALEHRYGLDASEAQSQRETAMELGTTEAAVAKRQLRGRARLSQDGELRAALGLEAS